MHTKLHTMASSGFPMHILELAEVATKPRLFRKIHGDENNCGKPNADDQCARPTLRPL